MPRGDPSPKVAITINRQQHDMAVAAAAKAEVSLSAWITEAIRRRLMIEDGLQAILEWELEHGPFTEAEIAASRARVDAQIDRHAARLRKRKRSA